VPATIGGVLPSYATEASYATGKILPFHKRLTNAFKLSSVRHTLMQPRLAMTAAMAFFSIALTLNLTGIRITNLRASDFTPSSIKRTFYDTNARVVRSIDNLRVVYELESRVRDLQRDSDSNTPAPQETSPAPVQSNPNGEQPRNDQDQQKQQKRSNPRQRSGSSRSLGIGHSLQFTTSLAQSGSSPEPDRKRQQVFLFTPTIFNTIEQGGQA
jgi:hypothetical protein